MSCRVCPLPELKVRTPSLLGVVLFLVPASSSSNDHLLAPAPCRISGTTQICTRHGLASKFFFTLVGSRRLPDCFAFLPKILPPPPCFCSTALSSVCLQLTGSGSSTSIMRSASLSLCAPCFFPVGNILQMSAAHHKRACVLHCSCRPQRRSLSLRMPHADAGSPRPHLTTGTGPGRPRAAGEGEGDVHGRRDTHPSRNHTANHGALPCPCPCPAPRALRASRSPSRIRFRSPTPLPTRWRGDCPCGPALARQSSRFFSCLCVACPTARTGVRGRQATRPASSRISSTATWRPAAAAALCCPAHHLRRRRRRLTRAAVR